MALTPEDVVNKRFQPTKFREGYDQDEVDDFLDEVVVELRRLGQENEELRQRLIAGESRINELQRSGGQAAAEQPQLAAPVPVPVPAALPAPVATPAYAAPSDPNAVDPSNTNNLLQLARKLHEEHVREGIEKRDALIAEGHTTAAKVVSDAEESHRAQLAELESAKRTQLAELEETQRAKLAEAEITQRSQLAELETSQRAQLAQLEQERTALEGRIEDLRTFEREYRQKLKSYIEGQLQELESPNSMANATPSGSGPSTPATPFPAASAQPASFQGFGGN